MTRAALVASFVFALCTAVFAASNQQPPPPDAPSGAPPEFTKFSPDELIRGFIAVAFGSDLRVGNKPKGIRKFTNPAHVQVLDQASVPRADAYRAILREFATKIPNLPVSLNDPGTTPNIVVRLIDEKNFVQSIESAFGRDVARRFIAKTDPQCVTSVKSDADGAILHADVFVIADKGDTVFYDCAYHETLHAFGLSNHADRNPWTTLNQNRIVGYLTVYDRALLAMLYNPRIAAGMTAKQVQNALPAVVAGLPFAR